MAGRSIIAKIETHAAAHAAAVEVLRVEIRSVRWLLSAAVIMITLIFAAGQFGFVYRQATNSPHAVATVESAPPSPAAPTAP